MPTICENLLQSAFQNLSLAQLEELDLSCIFFHV